MVKVLSDESLELNLFDSLTKSELLFVLCYF